MRKIKRRTILIIILLIILIVISGFIGYYFIEKRIIIELNPTGLINNTIDIYINDDLCFHHFVDEMDLITRPIQISEETTVTGFEFQLKVTGNPLNKTKEKVLNILDGHRISIILKDNTFLIRQFKDEPIRE